MSFDENWPRWIRTSINLHFANNKPINLKMIVEGQPRDTNNENDLFELRLDGPDSNEVSKGYWLLRMELNTLVQSIIDNKNIYRHDVIIGQIAAIFTSSILVRRCGDEPQDDDSILGCLRLSQVPGREVLEISRFGQLEPNLALEQSTIEGHYVMELDLTN